MSDFYKKLYDNDRVFLLSYYRLKLLKNNIYCDDPPQITIANIRKEIHPYYSEDEFKQINDEDLRKHFVDSEWMNNVIISDGSIEFYDGVYQEIKPVVNEIIKIFTSPEFNQFICKHHDLSLKREIINEKIKYEIGDDRRTIKESNLLLFIIEHFSIITDLYLEFKGEFIF